MNGTIELLTKSSYFTGLDKSQLEKIAAIATIQHHKKGAYLIKESEKGDLVYLVMKGRVSVSVSLAGQDKSEVIATLGEGEIIGEMILLGKNRRTADVIAKDELDVITWKFENLNKLFESDLQIGYTVMRNLAKQMAERLISTNQVLRNVLTVSTIPLY